MNEKDEQLKKRILESDVGKFHLDIKNKSIVQLELDLRGKKKKLIDFVIQEKNKEIEEMERKIKQKADEALIKLKENGFEVLMPKKICMYGDGDHTPSVEGRNAEELIKELNSPTFNEAEKKLFRKVFELEKKQIKEGLEKFKKSPTQHGISRGYYISIPAKEWEEFWKMPENSKKEEFVKLSRRDFKLLTFIIEEYKGNNMLGTDKDIDEYIKQMDDKI